MNYRALRILVWPASCAVLAILMTGSSQAARQDDQPAFRIVTSDVGDIMTEDVTPEIARTLNMTHPHGVVVTDVLYSPLRPGDVIVAINGKPVNCQNELNREMEQLGSAQTFTIDVLRDNAIQAITVQRAMELPVVLDNTGESRGIRVSSLSTENGVIVTDVRIRSVASDMGLRSGDLILEVNGHDVHSAAEFQEFMAQLSDRLAALIVRQRDGQVNVFVIS